MFDSLVCHIENVSLYFTVTGGCRRAKPQSWRATPCRLSAATYTSSVIWGRAMPWGAVYTPCSLSGVSCHEITWKQRGVRPIADMWLLSARVTVSSIAHYGVSRPRQSTSPLGGTFIQYKAVRIRPSLCLAVCLFLFRYVITQKGETQQRQWLHKSNGLRILKATNCTTSVWEQVL